jgi:hypothetical protein
LENGCRDGLVKRIEVLATRNMLCTNSKAGRVSPKESTKELQTRSRKWEKVLGCNEESLSTSKAAT